MIILWKFAQAKNLNNRSNFFWIHFAFIPIHNHHIHFHSVTTINITLYCTPHTTYKSNNKQTFYKAIKFRPSAPTSRGQSHLAELDDFSFHYEKSKPISFTQKTTYQHINLFDVFLICFISRWWIRWRKKYEKIELTLLKQ